MGRFSLRAMLAAITAICLLLGANSLSGAKWEWDYWYGIKVQFGEYGDEQFACSLNFLESWEVDGGTIYHGKMRRIWTNRRGSWFKTTYEQRYIEASDRECYYWAKDWPQDLGGFGVTNRKWK